MKRRSESVRRLDREIFRLALPALATLISEPLLLLADSAIVGHLGTDQLAGLAIAANLLGILTGLCIFLAYGTTGTVARRLGAGDHRGSHGRRVRRARARADPRYRPRRAPRSVPGPGGRRVRGVAGGDRGRVRLSADRRPRSTFDLDPARRDRCAARTPGHADAALRGDRRQPDQHRAQLRAGLRGWARDRRLGVGDPDRPDHGRRGPRRGDLDPSAPSPGQLAVPAPGRAGRGPVRSVAGTADSRVADRHHAHHVRGGGRRSGHAGGPSGSEQPVDPAGVRPRCDRDCRPGDHRPDRWAPATWHSVGR